MLETIYTRLTKDKIFKYEAYDEHGNVARGRTKQAAINMYHALYSKEEISYGYDVEKLEKKINL